LLNHACLPSNTLENKISKSFPCSAIIQTQKKPPQKPSMAVVAKIPQPKNCSLQPKRVLRCLPVSSNTLAARQVFVRNILLVALPLKLIFGALLHARCGFASRYADTSCELADGGLETFLEHLSDGVADDAEEALKLLVG
jgi:hypothetical protein